MTKGEYARRARQKRSVSIKELAYRSGVKRDTISRIEHDLTDPRLSTLELLAESLEIGIDEYIGHQSMTQKRR